MKNSFLSDLVNMFLVVACIVSSVKIYSLSSDIIRLQNLNDMQKTVISDLTEELAEYDTANIKVTAYHPNSRGTNSDSCPTMTATMTPHKAGYTCAISTDLVKMGWLGKEIYIRGYGIVLANDRLATTIDGFQIDLCKGSYKDAMKVGVNYDVLATLVDRKFINRKISEN